MLFLNSLLRELLALSHLPIRSAPNTGGSDLLSRKGSTRPKFPVVSVAAAAHWAMGHEP